MTARCLSSLQVEPDDRQFLQDLGPLLETLSNGHPVAEVQDMVNDLRIAIVTHNAVWSQRMKDAAENLGHASGLSTTCLTISIISI